MNADTNSCFQMEEIFDFTQDDLLDRDVFVLDCKDTIWVWFGKNSVPILQQLTLETLLVRTFQKRKYIGGSNDTCFIGLC